MRTTSCCPVMDNNICQRAKQELFSPGESENVMWSHPLTQLFSEIFLWIASLNRNWFTLSHVAPFCLKSKAPLEDFQWNRLLIRNKRFNLPTEAVTQTCCCHCAEDAFWISPRRPISICLSGCWLRRWRCVIKVLVSSLKIKHSDFNQQ